MKLMLLAGLYEAATEVLCVSTEPGDAIFNFVHGFRASLILFYYCILHREW